MSEFEPGRFGELLTRRYARYLLVRRRIPSGELLDTLHLADREDDPGVRVPAILGATPNTLWIWRDSLEGRRLDNLALAITPGTLALPSGVPREVLPREASAYTVAATAPPSLVVKGTDARFYQVDEREGALAGLDAAALPGAATTTSGEARFDALVPPGQGRRITHPYRAMQKSFLTVTGRWYSLLSEEERARLGANVAAEDAPSGDVARTLHGGPWRADDRGHPVLDVGRVEAVGNERLLQAGFVVRWAQRVWDVADPSSSLVLAKARLGAEEPWELMRLARDGRVLWRTSTGLASPGAILDLGDYIALAGLPPGTRNDPDELVTWIHTGTGARTELRPATGAVRAIPTP